MTDQDILPIDGGDTPDDPVLKARLQRAYLATPLADASMVERCVRHVLDQAQSASRPPAISIPPSQVIRGRVWATGMLTAAAAGLLIAVLNRDPAPVSQNVSTTTTATDGGVQFELRLPKDAVNVSVIGDFNGWDATASRGSTPWPWPVPPGSTCAAGAWCPAAAPCR
ncbi:MAG: hypothetical protein ACO1Q7_08855, partial [Gemmatimonas sp.]